MAMLQIWVFESLHLQTASHYAVYITDIVYVSPLASSVEPADRLLKLKQFTHMKVTTTLYQFHSK